ncbi:MAG: hypothetical protein DI600_09895 [Cutibacterium granulosum]|jgi:hypothetical protein|nr:MAG: hypothetical protein DI600_09895 [Cutibacterium granulosum]
MTNFLNTVVILASDSAGISGIWDDVRGKWIGPLFLMAVAAFAIKFIKTKEWTKLFGFVGISALVGLLIFGGGALFGGDGVFSKLAGSGSKKVTNSGGGKDTSHTKEMGNLGTVNPSTLIR